MINYRFLTGIIAFVLVSSIVTPAFAATGSGDNITHPITSSPSQVVPTPVDCDVDSNVVAWVTNNGGTVADYLDIANEIETNLGVTPRNVAIINSVPSCIEKLVITHAPGACHPSGIGAVAEAAVLDWVTNQGGELLILEEFVGCGGGSAALTLAFGATHNLDLVIDTGFPGEAYSGAALNAAHPIMAGITTMNMQAGTDFTSDGTLTTIVTDADNNLPVLLAGPVNDGCVVISGDSNWMGDPGSALTINDNKVAANNVFNFLNNICNPDIVGGEFSPIDTTSLLLAGAQSTTWMIPLVLSVLGIGLFVVSRKSESS